jgi:ribonucleotide reductase beta subunit family protein with ferritin-like domain
VQIAKMSKSALAKEQILMKAQQLQYEYLAFRERTNIEAVLATMLAEKTQQVNSKQKLQAIANTPETPAAG